MSIPDAINDSLQVNNISDHVLGLCLQAVGGSVLPHLFRTVLEQEATVLSMLVSYWSDFCNRIYKTVSLDFGLSCRKCNKD